MLRLLPEPKKKTKTKSGFNKSCRNFEECDKENNHSILEKY